MTDAVLYDYWRSSASYRLRIALNLAGIHFTSCPKDLVQGEHSEPEYLQINPQGLVPALILDGQRLTQSLAAIEFMDENGYGSFLPDDPSGRARVRTIAYSIAMEIHPICNHSVGVHVANQIAGQREDDEESHEKAMESWMIHFMTKGLQSVERLLDAVETGRCCHGDTPTMADICLIPQLYNARRRKINIEQFERISSISAGLEERAPFRSAHPDNFKPGE